MEGDIDEGPVTVLLEGDDEGAISWGSASTLDDLDPPEDLDPSNEPKFGLEPVYSMEVETVQSEMMGEQQEVPSPSVEQKRSSLLWPRR